MEFKVVQVEKYGKVVWSHEEMDFLRETHCLCLNCQLMSGCKTAALLYSVCIQRNLAMAITRCPTFEVRHWGNPER